MCPYLLRLLILSAQQSDDLRGWVTIYDIVQFKGVESILPGHKRAVCCSGNEARCSNFLDFHNVNSYRLRYVIDHRTIRSFNQTKGEGVFAWFTEVNKRVDGLAVVCWQVELT